MGTEEACHLPAGLGPSPGLTGGSGAARAGRLCGSWVSVPHLFIELNAIQIELAEPHGSGQCASESSGDAGTSRDAHILTHPPSGKEPVGLETVLITAPFTLPPILKKKLHLEKRWPGFSPKFPWVPSTPPLQPG